MLSMKIFFFLLKDKRNAVYVGNDASLTRIRNDLSLLPQSELHNNPRVYTFVINETNLPDSFLQSIIKKKRIDFLLTCQPFF